MAEQSRVPFTPTRPGPYVGIVVGNQDSTFMGTLEVAIVKSYEDDPSDVAGQSVPARYLSPFSGATPLKYVTGNSATSFQETQKSYGFWMVPPDIGTRVLVIFVDGDYSQCYWIGCIQDKYMNYMIPGIAAQNLPATALSSDQQSSYGGDTLLPVAEYNKAVAATTGGVEPNNPIRPVHPFADVLQAQGLLEDTIRGVTSSSARREAPSSVFGISTPGPLDTSDGAQTGSLTYGGKTVAVPASRLGGTQFVMDDGDADGNNELVRIRTRTGHQILLHNTADLIYIANSGGTAWIELTSNGKIDIYAKDSISIHTEENFNFKAEKNINFEGQNINMAASGSIGIQSKGSLGISVTGATTLNSHGAISFSTDKDLSSYATGSLKLTGGITTNLTGGTINIGGAGTINYNAGTHKFQGSHQTHTSADKPTPATYAKVAPLPEYAISTGGSGSSNSIMTRIPQSEPWSDHENNDPAKFNPVNLDNTPVDSNNQAVPGAAPPYQPAGEVNADNSIRFTSGSGDKAHFAKTTAEFQKAFQALAVEYKQNQGRPVTLSSSYRSYDEQLALYNLWLAGQPKGGGYKATVYVPGRGNITTPAKPSKNSTTTHAQGIAADIDESQATYMYRTKLLDKYGFTWGGTWAPHPDRVHIQLSNPTIRSSE